MAAKSRRPLGRQDVPILFLIALTTLNYAESFSLAKGQFNVAKLPGRSLEGYAHRCSKRRIQPWPHLGVSLDKQEDFSRRPEWALDWMPTWLITMKPRSQLLIGTVLYVVHLKVLTQHSLAFPFQLIPNTEGRFQSIGLDS
jgi:hypothetical protein